MAWTLLALASSACAVVASGSGGPAQALGQTFVVARPYESHALACTRAGLRATEREITLGWNDSALEEVSRALGFVASRTNRTGCCVAGMWCDETDRCFTHTPHSTVFVNHGWFAAASGAAALRPVFTCRAASPGNAALATPTVTNVEYSSQIVNTAATPIADAASTDTTTFTITGTNFGQEQGDISVAVGAGTATPLPCTDVQLCNRICRPCGTSRPACGHNEVCVSDNVRPRQSQCIPYCGRDTCGRRSLCPCGTKCYAVIFHNSFQRQRSYICAPANPLGTQGICGGALGTALQAREQLTCTVRNPAVAAGFVDGRGELTAQIAWTGSSPASGVGVALAVPQRPQALRVTGCNDAQQCDDLDPCTLDTCGADGRCIHTPSLICQTQPASSLRRHGRVAYDVLRLPHEASDVALINNATVQAAAGFLTSTVATKDDGPLQPVTLPFEFPLYQERHTRAYISPNGMIQFESGEPCGGIPFAEGCVIVDNYASVVAPFFADFDPSRKRNSGVRYRRSAQKLEVVWRDVELFKYGSGGGVGYTVAATLFSDGSIRFFWKTVPTAHTEFSRAYLKPKPLREAMWLSGLLAPRSQARREGGGPAGHVFLGSFDPDLGGRGGIAPKDGDAAVLCRFEPVASLTPAHGPVAGNTAVTVLWTDPACAALGASGVAGARAALVRCVFGGVVVPTEAVGAGRYRCSSPSAPSGRAGAVAVELVLTGAANGVNARLPLYAYNKPAGGASPRSRQLMFEYTNASSGSASKLFNSCSTTGHAPATTDRCRVCGGDNSSADCFGHCFGSAGANLYDGACQGKCTGGSRFSDTTYNPTVHATCRLKLASGCAPAIDASQGTGVDAHSPTNGNNSWGGQRAEISSNAGFMLVAVLACTLVLLSLCMWVVRLIVARRLQGTEGNVGAERQRGLTADQLVEFTTVLSAEQVDAVVARGESCSICLCDFEAGDTLRAMPCHASHVYHSTCIDEWLQQSRLCPMCKQDIQVVSSRSDSQVSAREENAEQDDGDSAQSTLADAGAGAGASARPITGTARPALRSIEVTPAPRANTPGRSDDSPSQSAHGGVITVHVEPSRSVQL